MTTIRGPYYRHGYHIRGKNERIVATIDPWDQHGDHERNMLISDLIDYLTKRDEERKDADKS